jgi:ankyrin repeat protein
MRLTLRSLSLLAAFFSAAGLASAADLRLVAAVEHRDQAAIHSLLDPKDQTGPPIDVNARQPDGATAIAWAAHWDDLQTADLLIHAGADVNLANDHGVSPLWLACTNGSAAMVEKLLKAGADPNAALRLSGETALMSCARTGNVEAVRWLLEHGADVNSRESWREQTALMWAVAEKHADVAEALLKQGAGVNARTRSGFTALMFAAQQGHQESAEVLLAAGANVNDATPQGMTALLIAGASGRPALAETLLNRGADPNSADNRGYTALHYAAGRAGMVPLIQALLAKGANPNAQLTRGEVGATPFFLAAAAGNVEAMRVLAAGGAGPDLPTKENTTPLLVAAGVGRFESRDPADEQNALAAVKLALELGANVYTTGENSWTALHGAAYTGADGIIEVLVQNGAKLDVMDKFGQTPLSIAEAVVTEGLGELADVRPRRFRESTVNLLLKLGATPTELAGVKAVGSMAVKPAR